MLCGQNSLVQGKCLCNSRQADMAERRSSGDSSLFGRAHSCGDIRAADDDVSLLTSPGKPRLKSSSLFWRSDRRTVEPKPALVPLAHLSRSLLNSRDLTSLLVISRALSRLVTNFHLFSSSLTNFRPLSSILAISHLY